MKPARPSFAESERVAALGVAVASLVLSLVLTSSPVLGQVPCDALLVDETGTLGDGALHVHRAATGLSETGAEVHVILVRSSGGDLDAYMNHMRTRCSSWQGPAGRFKADLLVLAVSVDEQLTGIYYGSRWENHLDGHYQRIQEDFMHPRFLEGEISAGMTAGLEEFARVLSRPPEPGTPTRRDPAGMEPRVGFNLLYAAAAVIGALLALWLSGAGVRSVVQRRRAG